MALPYYLPFNETCVIYKNALSLLLLRPEKKKRVFMPGGVQLSIVVQLDEDQEASMKRGIRVRFNIELVSVARSP